MNILIVKSKEKDIKDAIDTAIESNGGINSMLMRKSRPCGLTRIQENADQLGVFSYAVKYILIPGNEMLAN